MTTVVRPEPSTAADLAAPEWAQLPAPTVGRRTASARRNVAVRAALAGLVAIVLWRIGHQLPAIVLVVVSTVLGVTALLVPPVARAIDRATSWIQRSAGRILTVLVLSVIHVVIFMPAALVLRLIGHDPIALGSTPDDPSFWRPAPALGRRPLYDRPFTYERPTVVADTQVGVGGRSRFPLTRVRGALGLVVVIALLDLAVGQAIAFVDPDPADAPPRAPVTPRVLANVAAGEDEPWRLALAKELSRAYSESIYHPYRGWTAADQDGRYVNVTDGVRRSYRPAGGSSEDAIEVSFFGGSAMLGWFQRDEHTIPSEVARLAEQDGITLRVANHGQPAYQNWQETLLLQELVTGGEAPDLAVFYDGGNELAAQLRSGPTSDPTHIQAREIERALFLDETTEGQDDESFFEDLSSAYADTSASYRLARRIKFGLFGAELPERRGLTSPWPNQNEDPEASGRAAATLYGRGVDIARRLAESYGFESAFFWQPLLYSKDAHPAERDVRGSWGTNIASWRTANDTARADLPEPVVDLSDGLDGADAPVMYDFIHTNEEGARIMAEALYDELRPSLLRLAAQDR